MTLRIVSEHQEASAVSVLPPRPKVSMADEAHHRIANNLQLLATMVSIEARRMVDPLALAALDMTQRRIMAIAGVHRQLYQAGRSAAVDLGCYLQALGDDLEHCCGDSATGRHVRATATDAVMVGAEEATALGIVVSELVSNACKYAYAPGQPGDVAILLSAMPFGGYRLDVVDYGRGLRVEDMPRGTGLGTRLVRMMAAKINATCAWHDAAPGTRFTLYAA